MKEKIYDARTGMEYVLVGDYYLPALKLPRTRPIGRWGMLHKAYLKLRKPAYYQSLLLSGKLDTVLANVEEQRNADMNSGRIMNLLVTIPAESRRMNVGKDVIRVLGSPAYICVLQRKDRKAIAITPCAAEHPMSFKVPGRLLTDGQCRMMINGIQFIQVLLEANGLAAGKDHQFKGRYDAEKNAVIISLEKDEQSALSPQKCTT